MTPYLGVYVPTHHAVDQLGNEAEQTGEPYEVARDRMLRAALQGAEVGIWRITRGEVTSEQTERLRQLLLSWWYGVESDQQLVAREENR